MAWAGWALPTVEDGEMANRTDHIVPAAGQEDRKSTISDESPY